MRNEVIDSKLIVETTVNDLRMRHCDRSKFVERLIDLKKNSVGRKSLQGFFSSVHFDASEPVPRFPQEPTPDFYINIVIYW